MFTINTHSLIHVRRPTWGAVPLIQLFVLGCSADAELVLTETGSLDQAITAQQFDDVDRSKAVIGSDSATTLVSGNGPLDASLSKSISYNAGLTGVEWGEDTDDPCYLEASFDDVATGAAESRRTFDRCDGHNPGNMKYVYLPQDYFVTSVKVCHDSDREKVKGIELSGQHILCLLGAPGFYTLDDGVTPVYGPMEYTLHGDAEPRWVACGTSSTEATRSDDHTHCRYWGTERSCPAGMVATGLKFGLADASGDREMIEGIALMCNEISE